MGKVNKTVTIEPQHQRFLEEKGQNLSEMVRERIQEEIQKTGWHPCR